MTASLTFIVPGLLDPVPYLEQVPAQELPELPLFNKILSRGQWILPAHENTQPYGFYSTIISELTQSEINNTLPLASFLYLAENQSIEDPRLKQKWIMRVDPCVMAPDRDQLLLTKIYLNNIEQAEADQLLQEINAFYKTIEDDIQWQLYALAPEHWYLVCEQPIQLDTFPPEKVLNKPLKHYLPKGKESAYWRNLFNEFQMILHQSPVNQQRMQQGKAALNSVWFWGNGPVDLAENDKELNNTQLYSDLDFVKGLAKHYKTECAPIPEQLKSVSFTEQDRHIFVIRDFMDDIEQRDLFQWLERLKTFESHFLADIVELLSNKTIDQCELVSPSGKRLLVTRRLLSRFWKKSLLWQYFDYN